MLTERSGNHEAEASKATQGLATTRGRRKSLSGWNTVENGPLGLYLYAEQFLSAAKSVQAPVETPKFPMARTFLICRTIELALKAFLSLKGVSWLELSGGAYGRDLKNLIEESEKRGLHALVELNDSQRFQIIRASTYYLEKVFEYPALIEALSGNPGLPTDQVLLDAAEALVSAIRRSCLEA